MKTHNLNPAIARPAGKKPAPAPAPAPAPVVRRYGVVDGASKQWTHAVFDDERAARRRMNEVPGTIVIELITGGMHNFTGECISAESVVDAQLAADFARATGVDQRLTVESRRGKFFAVVSPNGLLTRCA